MKPDQQADDTTARTAVPVVEEVPVVGKRRVISGRLLVHKTVTEREVVIDEPMLRHDVRIERVSIGRDLSATEVLPVIRYVADTIIIPVLHEVPVLVKKVVLAEEIRITRLTSEARDPQTMTVRVEEVSLVRQDEAETPPEQGESSALS